MITKRLEPSDAKEPLWLLIPKVAYTISITYAAILLAGYFTLWGDLHDKMIYAFWVATFISVFEVLMIVGWRFGDRPDLQAGVPQAKGGLSDKVGGFWLAACFLGPILGWLCGQAATDAPPNIFLYAKVLFAVVLPVLTMLPLLRYMSLKAAFVQVPILLGITALPLLTGLDAAVKLGQYFAK